MNSSLYPIESFEVDGARLVERWALKNPTSVNASLDKKIGRTIDKKNSWSNSVYGKAM